MQNNTKVQIFMRDKEHETVYLKSYLVESLIFILLIATLNSEFSCSVFPSRAVATISSGPSVTSVHISNTGFNDPFLISGVEITTV